ncbi:MAG: SCO family protein [Geminicoccaceae bacterium]
MRRFWALMALKLVLAGLVVAGLVTWTLGIGPFSTRLEAVTASQGKALIGGPFSLIDQTGKRVTEADFAGRATLVYFGYTFCPDVCPTGLATMMAAYDALTPEEQAKVVPIFVTVDPERDDVAAMASYVALFHPALVGLTGTVEETDAAAAAWRVYHRKAESEAASDYLVDHSSFTYLMDGRNEYVTHFSHGTTPEAMAEGIRTALAEGAAG